jgi:predicted acylesterase/phospholipase RssA
VFNDINKLGEWCRKNIGDLTFKEAFDRTGRIINITVPTYRVTGFRGAATLLNYITAPNVVIWSAACASCEYPGLYSRFELRCVGPALFFKPRSPAASSSP